MMTKDDYVKYDERSGCFVSRGQDYGVGKKQPIGSKNVTYSDRIPQKAYQKDIRNAPYEEKEKQD